MEKPVLYHVYDPMCSWCWGYRDTWLKLSDALSSVDIEIQYQLGGLAPDSDMPMPIEMQQTLQGIWRNINAKLGTQFNFDFWTHCQPQRSTYPACRACLIARSENKEKEMLFAIQQAYYLQAKNPSLVDTLSSLATEIGFDKAWFEQQLVDDQINQQFIHELNQTHQLPVQGFPSLVLSIKGQNVPIRIDYIDWQKTFAQITKLLVSKA